MLKSFFPLRLDIGESFIESLKEFFDDAEDDDFILELYSEDSLLCEI